MDLMDLASLAQFGPPGLGPGVELCARYLIFLLCCSLTLLCLVISTYKTIESIKIYKVSCFCFTKSAPNCASFSSQQQCSDMSGRCVNLMIALRDSSAGLEGTKAIELADEITASVSIVRMVSSF